MTLVKHLSAKALLFLCNPNEETRGKTKGKKLLLIIIGVIK